VTYYDRVATHFITAEKLLVS